MSRDSQESTSSESTSHGTATTMSRVLLQRSHSVYIGRIPGDPTEPKLLGDLLVEMQLSKRGGLVIGVRTQDGEEAINPPKSKVLEPGSMLIYLAEKPLLEPPSPPDRHEEHDEELAPEDERQHTSHRPGVPHQLRRREQHADRDEEEAREDLPERNEIGQGW
jgi:hypothetical protein